MKKQRILVVDDERLIVITTRLLLEHMGFLVEEAYNGEEALEKASSPPPDLILLDLKMPGMDGWQVLRRLKSDPYTAGVPVVLFTAKEYSGRGRTDFLQGAQGFLPKPFEPEEMADIVNRLLGDGSGEAG